jgi:hypothetical protein
MRGSITNENHYGERFSAQGYGVGPTGPNVPQHIIDHNLMRPGGTSENEEIGASKRLYKVQQERLRENLLQKLN